MPVPRSTAIPGCVSSYLSAASVLAFKPGWQKALSKVLVQLFGNRDGFLDPEGQASLDRDLGGFAAGK